MKLGNVTFRNSDAQGTVDGSEWALEESIDVEWAHAVAPEANIVLYEANWNGGDLYTAVSTAATSREAVVSMSWGGSEFSGETAFDSVANRRGVTFLACTGDLAQRNIPRIHRMSWPLAAHR